MIMIMIIIMIIIVMNNLMPVQQNSSTHVIDEIRV
jgi:hypothetical protein